MAGESTDYKTFRKHFSKSGIRLDRIENLVVDGMPDVNICIDGVESWIENKSPIEPKRNKTPLFGSNHKISVSQRNWMIRHVQSGGIGYYLVASDKRWLLMPGKYMDDINQWTVNEMILNSIWHAIKPIIGKEKWKQLENILRQSR